MHAHPTQRGRGGEWSGQRRKGDSQRRPHPSTTRVDTSTHTSTHRQADTPRSTLCCSLLKSQPPAIGTGTLTTPLSLLLLLLFCTPSLHSLPAADTPPCLSCVAPLCLSLPQHDSVRGPSVNPSPLTSYPTPCSDLHPRLYLATHSADSSATPASPLPLIICSILRSTID